MISGLPDVRTIGESSMSILQMSSSEAKNFLLKGASYCNIDFPPYIVFDPILMGIDKYLNGKMFNDLIDKKEVRNTDDVNHILFTNKDGKYAWRPLELIHPALYVALINLVTDAGHWETILNRFNEFSSNPQIKCLSLPVISLTDEKDKAEQVSHWWHEVEQQSIELAMNFSYLITTDITDCYGSIYTHSISWALHTKEQAKANQKEKSFIGNQIDWHIQNMRQGQTNGIPQGSVLMDFTAEMVLGYSDLLLTKKIIEEGIEDYQILRYRDDYRIFVNNPQDGESILRILTQVLVDIGLKLKPSKTNFSNRVIKDSIKLDKLSWVSRHKFERSLFKQLLIIHDHASEYPNSGSLVRALSDFQIRLEKRETIKDPVLPIISTTVDIGFSNPKTHPIISAILSKLLEFIDDPVVKLKTLKSMKIRFSKVPNTGYLDIWLQRFTMHIDNTIEYEEPLCKLISGQPVTLWNSDWISSSDLKRLVRASEIIDVVSISEASKVITSKEIELFLQKTSGQFSA